MSNEHPQHDPSNEENTPVTDGLDPVTLAAIDAALTAEHEQAVVVDPMLREFQRAVTDCGLPLRVEQVESVDDTFKVHFEALTWQQMRRLVNILRDIADDRPVQVMAGPEGPSLFDIPTPAGPVPAPTSGNGLHIEVPA